MALGSLNLIKHLVPDIILSINFMGQGAFNFPEENLMGVVVGTT
jgi:hypothetical protein